MFPGPRALMVATDATCSGTYKVKFSWNEGTRPPVVDSEGTPITACLVLVEEQYNISFSPLENESLLLKENSMQLHVKKLCRGGRWFLYLAVPHRRRMVLLILISSTTESSRDP
jgi:hypothetical protein